MHDIDEITAEGKLSFLKGKRDIISDSRMIELNLAIDIFKNKNILGNINGVYFISELSDPYIKIEDL